MSGFSNLNLIARLHKGLRPERLEEVLDKVGLLDRAKDDVKAYSLGMRQRLGIAAALLREPKLIILDEPTNGLDPQGVIEMRGLINSLVKDRNITFLISSHSLHEIEQMCNKVGIIQNGKLLKQCSIKKVIEMDFENVKVLTNNMYEAMDLLKKEAYVRSAEITRKGITLCVDKGKSAEINRILAVNSIFAEFIIPVEKTLEQSYLDIIKGENEKCLA
jgi:ABC-2 type transport system ATP-binding protein